MCWFSLGAQRWSMAVHLNAKATGNLLLHDMALVGKHTLLETASEGLGTRRSLTPRFHSYTTTNRRASIRLSSRSRRTFPLLRSTMQAHCPSTVQEGKSEAFKLATLLTPKGDSTVGIIRGDFVWPLQDVVDLPSDFDLSKFNDMTAAIRHWDIIENRIVLNEKHILLSDATLKAPIPRPTGAIMCIGKNYVDHVKEVDTWKVAPGIAAPDVPKHPIVFTKAPQSVIGPGDVIRYPHGVSSEVDYEAELGVIIGKEGRNIKKDMAMSYVFGYTIINDVTARDLQKRHQQWFLGKSCDTFCPMGPYIVPATSMNGLDARIQCWVNEELRQDGRTSDMIFSIPELIEVISSAITLQPGDIIATGTPAGVGSGFNPPKHLKPGDHVRIMIEGIGKLENTVQ